MGELSKVGCGWVNRSSTTTLRSKCEGKSKLIHIFRLKLFSHFGRTSRTSKISSRRLTIEK